jgi:hypothetical protein
MHYAAAERRHPILQIAQAGAVTAWAPPTPSSRSRKARQTATSHEVFVDVAYDATLEADASDALKRVALGPEAPGVQWQRYARGHAGGPRLWSCVPANVQARVRRLRDPRGERRQRCDDEAIGPRRRMRFLWHLSRSSTCGIPLGLPAAGLP